MSVSFLTSLTEKEFKEFLKEALKEILGESLSSKTNLPEILNVQQAAEFLKLQVSTLYEKTSRKLIPHFKKGNKLYFHLPELQQWVLEGKVKTAEQTSNEAITYLLLNKQN